MYVFDVADIAELVDSFCSRIPALLAEHSVTADVVQSVVGLREQSETPFTVAVVGQMRVGKSSLINAILGKDLAETGVTETTATINWIRHGVDSGYVRVHWKDKPSELIARDQLKKWTGDSAHAANTRYVELFDDADFLKVASIVDTPGLRSVIEQHTDATESFLGLRCEQETRAVGSKADAIVYVLMPVARDADDAFLEAFLNQTRLPGSTSFNSLAVLHKWETLESEDPAATSHSKARRIAEALGDALSTVIPVSAPLAWATKHVHDSLWDCILQIGRDTPRELLTKMLMGERRFMRDVAECPVSTTERGALLACGLPWPSLKVIISIASQRQYADAADLRETIAEVGQVDFLLRELDRRFFARSRSLKILSTVAKAWKPCQLAQLRLRRRRTQVGELLASSQKILSLLEDRIEHGDRDLESVKHYVLATEESLRREHVSLGAVLKSVSEEVTRLKAVYDEFVADLASLELLASSTVAHLSASDMGELNALFGGQGTAVSSRLAPLLNGKMKPIESIEIAIEKFADLRRRSNGDVKLMLAHALARLEQLANQLEFQQQGT